MQECLHMHRILPFLVVFGLALLAACSGSGQTAAPTPTTAAKAATTPSPAAAAAAVSSPSPATSAGGSPSPAAAAAVSSPSPATATALPPPTTPSPTAGAPATATPVTAQPQTVWVANTDGGGVWLRNSEHDGDRTEVVLADGTQLTITGEEVEGDGQRWYPVRTTENREGFVQVIYTSQTPPSGPPEAPRGEPK
jgi:hypothetical protein